MIKNEIIRRALAFAYKNKDNFVDLLEDRILENEGLAKLTAILQRLCEDDFIDVKPTFTNKGPYFLVKLTEKGIHTTEKKDALNLHFPIIDNNLCFVVMSFNKDNKDLVDIYAAIKRTVYSFKFTCKRVDEIEENRRITDTIISTIQNAGFIITDLTESRPNCYYELGYAHALGKQVIQTCDSKTPLHFDIASYPTIIYETKTELEERLKEKIKDRIDKGLISLPKIK
jgi:hypothetical protein